MNVLTQNRTRRRRQVFQSEETHRGTRCLLRCERLESRALLAGDLEFAFALGGVGSEDLADAVAFDDQGNVVVVGRLESPLADFDPGPGVTNLSSEGGLNGFVAQYTRDGALNWAFSIGDTGYDYALTVATDSDGDVYIGGGFNGTVDFDPGPGVYSLTDSGGGGQDSFLLKLDRQGVFQWARSFGSAHPYAEGIYDLEVDVNNDVVIAGTFQSDFDIDPGAGSTILSTSSLRAYVAKFDAAGDFLWGVAPEDTSNCTVYGLGLDDAGNVYVTGGFDGMADFDPSGGQDLEVGAGYGTAYLWKLNPSGGHQWAVSFPDAYYSYGADIAADSQGAIYLAGTFYTQVDFDPGPGSQIRTSASAGEGENFVLKVDTSGQFIWVAVAEGAGLDQAGGIAVGPQDHLYVTGRFSATVDFDPGLGVDSLTNTGSTDVFFWELDANGVFVDAQQFGGGDDGGYDDGIDVAVNGQSHVAIVGLFSGTADFDPGAGTLNLTSAGGYDAFVCLLASQQNAPVAVAGADQSAVEGSVVEFDGAGSYDPDGDELAYFWDFGDGVSASGATVSHQYFDNGTYTVTLRVEDGNGGIATDQLFVQVDNSPPVLAHVTTNAPFAQPGAESMPVTLHGAFTDAGRLDTHTAIIDWGDGSSLTQAIVIPTSGGGTVTSVHSYAQGGVFTVTLTVTDDDGGAATGQSPSVIAGAGVHLGVLQIVGDESANSITVNRQGNGWLKVHADLFPEANHRMFALSSVTAIQMWLGGGDDRATLAGNVMVPAVIVGGAGNDHLLGGGGRAILIGGGGADRLVGGPGDDLLIAGTTAYDANDAALLALLQEWNSQVPFATRVARMRAGIAVPGGEVARLQERLTVFDDENVDRLTGSSGMDWLFFDPQRDR